MTDAAALDFRLPPPDFARALIGAELTVDGVGGLIVETEAYDCDDPAAHSFRGPTPRTAPMFGPPGRSYVYLSMGIHWCMNFVCGPVPGGAVLIRALEPLHGLDVMAERRGLADPRALCSGPGKLCQALGITRALNDQDLARAPFSLAPAKRIHPIAVGPRIGISKGVDTPWRFGLRGSRFLSRPFPSV